MDVIRLTSKMSLDVIPIKRKTTTILNICNNTSNMKNICNKKFFLGFIAMMIVGGAFMACSKDSDPLDLQLLEEQAKQKVTLNKETSAFKADIISAISQSPTRVSETEFTFSAEQMKMLRESSLNMFRSHGFSEKEVLDVVDNNDIRLIFVATAFTALMEYPGTASYSMPKTRSESGETCYNIERIKHCLWEAVKDVFGLYDIMESIEKKCVTKTIALELLGKYAAYIDIATAIYDFSNCMGWI